MEIAGVDQELIDWSATRREQIDAALEGITDKYVAKHERLPGERAQHGLAWWAAQDTRREKKTAKPLEQLRAWWRASALLRFGARMVDGLLERCRAAGAAIRERVSPLVDTALAAVDVAAVVYVVRGVFARRHLGETLRGRPYAQGLDDYIADRALARHGRQLTEIEPGRRPPDADQISYTADFARPTRWWVASSDGKPPRKSTAYERAKVASRALKDAIRAARTAPRPVPGRPDDATAAAHTVSREHDRPDAGGRGVDHDHDQPAVPTSAQRAAAIHAHQQAAMPGQLDLFAVQAATDPENPVTETDAAVEPAPEPDEGRTTDPETWMRSPENLARFAAFLRESDARARNVLEREQREQREPKAEAADPGSQQQHAQQPAPVAGPGRARR